MAASESFLFPTAKAVRTVNAVTYGNHQETLAVELPVGGFKAERRNPAADRRGHPGLYVQGETNNFRTSTYSIDLALEINLQWRGYLRQMSLSGDIPG
jgi:hypothetical protein